MIPIFKISSQGDPRGMSVYKQKFLLASMSKDLSDTVDVTDTIKKIHFTRHIL